jgi:NitT/TauT family transport system permease protein
MIDSAPNAAVQATTETAPMAFPGTFRRRARRRAGILAAQVLLVAAVLCAWEWLPQIDWLADRSHIFDPFFISSPSRVGTRLYDLLAGRGADEHVPIWHYTWNTLASSMLGLLIGLFAGGLLGLLLGSSKVASDILRPFVVAMNAIPRIALIPIVMILFGPTFQSSVVVAVMITFFIGFFNAYEGARTVAPQLIQNAVILGASRTKVMLNIRMPYVLAWTIAALPLAATFSLTTVVFAELLVGSPGLGRQLGIATNYLDSTLTLALAVMLSVMGVLVVIAADLVTKRVLHWWGK